MKSTVTLSEKLWKILRKHLFQNDVEQGAFLFGKVSQKESEIILEVIGHYLVPLEGWAHQSAYHLELKDAERAKIMKMARDQSACLVDCHSHVNFDEPVSFSPSDIHGISEFSGYVKWKLDGKPYIALVFGEESIDAVSWQGDFKKPLPLDLIEISKKIGKGKIVPRYTWLEPRGYFMGRKNEGRKPARPPDYVFRRSGPKKNQTN